MSTTWVCITRWLVGLFVISGFLGHHLTRRASDGLHMLVARELNAKARVRSSWIPDVMGMAERASLTILLGVGAKDVLVAVVTWMLVKLAAGWQITAAPTTDDVDKGVDNLRLARSRAFVGLLGSMMSLWLGAIGGFVVNGSIPLVCCFKGSATP